VIILIIYKFMPVADYYDLEIINNRSRASLSMQFGLLR